jgi:hypothetical protein
MKITGIEIHPIRVPFDMGAAPKSFAGMNWTSVDSLFVRIAAAMAKAHSVDYVPHCFYFGPGYLASLHLAAAFAPTVPFELFFGDLEASPYHGAVRARGGRLAVPDGPGLGIEPDMKVIERYRLGDRVMVRA